MQHTSEAILNVEKIGNVGIDNLDSNYYSQVYSLSHNGNVKNIKLSVMGADNIKITDINNNVMSDITNADKIKILVPVSSVTDDKNIMLNFRTESLQTSVMFGATNVAGRQNMGLLLDPVNFRTVQSQFKIDYTTENIIIEKLDRDTFKSIKGVTFRFEKLDGTSLGEFTTDDNGYIRVDVKKDLKLFTEQKIRVVEVKAPSIYNISSANSRQIDIEWGVSNNITFYNEKKKGQIKVIKVDLDNNEVKLQGVEFNVLNSKGEVVDTIKTNARGEAVTKVLPIDDTYTVQETKTLQNYVLNNETQTVTLTENQVTDINFKNEKKKGQIRVIKVDLDNNEIKLQGIEFNILDSKGNVVDTVKTNANGEATTQRLPIDDTYTVQEIKTLDNYVLNEEVKTVTLTENQVTNITFENEKIKGRIKVIKLSSDDNKYTDFSKNTPLKDVEFQILDINKNVVDTIKTDENGIAITGDLIKGTYYIKEVKQADYYLLNEEIYEVEIVNHKDLIEQVILNDNVDIDIEIEKTGFIETQNKDNIYYNFQNIHNKSNVPLDNFTWNDTLPTEAVRLDKIYTGTWNEKLEYSVWYKTNNNDFKMFIDKLDTEIVYELDFNTLELEDDEYITEFEFRFGTVKIDFQEIESPIVYVNVLDNLKNGFTFTNKTKVSGNYLEEKIEDNDDWTTIIYNRKIKLNRELPKTGI